MGLPVIASRLGALTEKVQEAARAISLPPATAPTLPAQLQAIIDEPQRLAELRANIQPGPDIRQHAGQIAALYHELTADHSPAR